MEEKKFERIEGGTTMKLTFTEEQINKENYIITGIATIEGERYHEFEIEFELVEEPAEETLESIMETEWEWYDFLC